MTRLEEKLYLQSVFDVIDEVYKLKNHPPTLTYDERLRASFNKLLVPDWYNHDYTSVNRLRKTKSHGQVPAVKRPTYPPPNGACSQSSRETQRHRSPSRSWSERPPLRHHSTASSYETNGTVVIHGRRSSSSNGSSYAPGVQRVAQSSTWYKPESFLAINGVDLPPKPLPRYCKPGK